VRNIFKFFLIGGGHLIEMQSQYPSIWVDGHQFNIVYRNNGRAKRLSMRMAADYQGVLITIPPMCSKSDFERFLNHCTRWLEKKSSKWISRRVQSTSFEQGAVLPILGRSTEVSFDASCVSAKISLLNDRLNIPKKLDHPRVIQGFLNNQLFEYVNQKSKTYASLINVSIIDITVKPLKSSYGICSSKKTISYASRLVFAPLYIIDYVCAHEVAHLREMNHSAAFWKVVKELMPDYEIHKAWLKTHGYTLQLYGGGNT
jgi:predicted metal-dependent hydrolase